VLSATVQGVRRVLVDGAEIPALLIDWPEQIFEWQRRLDYRAPTPRDRRIAVTACLSECGATTPAACFAAQLIDVSAGGMSMGFPLNEYPRWESDDLVHCTFSPADGEPPLELVGRVRYAQRARETFRIGIQWYGLETTEEGRGVLDRIIDLCAEFQQVEIDRLAGTT
jgi:hypothetical protein